MKTHILLRSSRARAWKFIGSSSSHASTTPPWVALLPINFCFPSRMSRNCLEKPRAQRRLVLRPLRHHPHLRPLAANGLWRRPGLSHGITHRWGMGPSKCRRLMMRQFSRPVTMWSLRSATFKHNQFINTVNAQKLGNKITKQSLLTIKLTTMGCGNQSIVITTNFHISIHDLPFSC